MTIYLLQSPGITINYKKSFLVPSQRVQFIVAVIAPSYAFLQLDWTDIILHLVVKVTHSPLLFALHIQRLLDHMVAVVAVLPLAKLRMRPLQLSFLETHQSNMSIYRTLS